MSIAPTFDPIWEELRQRGQHITRYPYDFVVTFVFRNAPRDRSHSEVRILDIGCGVGNNVWFAAREGFQTAGIDGSATAIEYARRRFAEEGLVGDFQIGDFTALPFADETFDLAIDRGSIVCCGRSAGRKAVREVWRVLRKSGRFLFNPYSTRHSSLNMSDAGPDGLRVNVRGGNLTGVGQLCFYNKDEVLGALCPGWKLLSLDHLEIVTHVPSGGTVHADWRAVAEKVPISQDDHILRLAGPDDANKIFAWRNDPWIVSLSLSRKHVSADEHRVWFSSAIDRSVHLLFVVRTDEGVEAGTARVDLRAPEALITIYLLRQFTGRGLGPRAIDAACRRAFAEWPDVVAIRACIRTENEASMKAFRRAGFAVDQGAGAVEHVEMTRTRE
jgi:SAM-dependent methyltransferase